MVKMLLKGNWTGQAAKSSGVTAGDAEVNRGDSEKI